MQIRQFILIVCAAVLTSVAVNAQVPFYGEYKSPSKKLTVKLLQEDSRSYFVVYFNGRLVLDNSLLGIETSVGSFSYDLNLKSAVSSKVKSLKYTLNSGKKSLVSKKYREVIYPLVNLQGKEIDLIFRIFDDGVAYRYGLKGRGQCVVMKEQGNFAFPANTSCYMTPLATPKSGWAKTNPSNEEHYIYGEPSAQNRILVQDGLSLLCIIYLMQDGFLSVKPVLMVITEVRIWLIILITVFISLISQV